MEQLRLSEPGYDIMKNISWFSIILLIGTYFVLSGCKKGPTDPFEVGIGVTNITPPIGYSHYQGISTGVKDSLYAKALVFRQGDKRGALLICNLIAIPRDLSRLVRESVSKETGIPFQNISVAATHTHTGPSFTAPMQLYVEHEAVGNLSEEDHEGYIAFLIKRMTDALVSANDRLQKVAIKTGIGQATGISFNRRYLMTDGRVRMNPGRMNPKIVRPAGPVDPNVHFILFRPVSEFHFNASLTVFASHYVRNMYEFSSDYPFYLEKGLKKIFGEQIVSIFGSGTCGDINTIDAMHPQSPDTERVELVGKKLADAIREALPVREQRRPDFSVVSKTLYLPLQDFSEAELQWAKKDPADNIQLYPERQWVVKFRRGKILSLEKLRESEAIVPPVSGAPWTLPIEIHVFRLDSQTAIVTLPGEIFVEHGLAIKKHSPFANTMVIELANASIGYVPTQRAFAEGDYEAINSRLAPGSGEKMVEEVLHIMNNMKLSK
ncbi:MAG: neutral/alkaline non-lysosomal ceramidase N-terminal domain-containing protein [Bacteroidales bacterium]